MSLNTCLAIRKCQVQATNTGRILSAGQDGITHHVENVPEPFDDWSGADLSQQI